MPARYSPNRYRMPIWISRPERNETGCPKLGPSTPFTLATLARLNRLNASASTLIWWPPGRWTTFSPRMSMSEYTFVRNELRGCVVSRWSTSPSPSRSRMPRGLYTDPLRQ